MEEIMPTKRAVKRISSQHGRSPNILCDDLEIQMLENVVRRPVTKVEKEKFRQFQRVARKAGLLVTRLSYQLYFEDAP